MSTICSPFSPRLFLSRVPDQAAVGEAPRAGPMSQAGRMGATTHGGGRGVGDAQRRRGGRECRRSPGGMLSFGLHLQKGSSLSPSHSPWPSGHLFSHKAGGWLPRMSVLLSGDEPRQRGRGHCRSTQNSRGAARRRPRAPQALSTAGPEHPRPQALQAPSTPGPELCRPRAPRAPSTPGSVWHLPPHLQHRPGGRTPVLRPVSI